MILIRRLQAVTLGMSVFTTKLAYEQKDPIAPTFCLLTLILIAEYLINEYAFLHDQNYAGDSAMRNLGCAYDYEDSDTE